MLCDLIATWTSGHAMRRAGQCAGNWMGSHVRLITMLIVTIALELPGLATVSAMSALLGRLGESSPLAASLTARDTPDLRLDEPPFTPLRPTLCASFGASTGRCSPASPGVGHRLGNWVVAEPDEIRSSCPSAPT